MRAANCWQAAFSPAAIAAVMTGEAGTQGVSFIGPGRMIRESAPQAKPGR